MTFFGTAPGRYWRRLVHPHKAVRRSRRIRAVLTMLMASGVVRPAVMDPPRSPTSR